MTDRKQRRDYILFPYEQWLAGAIIGLIIGGYAGPATRLALVTVLYVAVLVGRWRARKRRPEYGVTVYWTRVDPGDEGPADE